MLYSKKHVYIFLHVLILIVWWVLGVFLVEESTTLPLGERVGTCDHTHRKRALADPFPRTFLGRGGMSKMRYWC